MKTALRIFEGLIWVAAYFAVVFYFRESSELGVLICGLGITIYSQIKGYSQVAKLFIENKQDEFVEEEIEYLDFFKSFEQYDDLAAKISRALMSGLVGLWIWYFLEKAAIADVAKWVIMLIGIHAYLVMLEMLRLARLRPISGLETSYQTIRLIILFSIGFFVWKNGTKLHSMSLIFAFVIYALDQLGGFLIAIHEKLEYFKNKFASKTIS